MKHYIQNVVYRIANILELIISCFVVFAIIVLFGRMVLSMDMFLFSGTIDEALTKFLSNCFSFIIGIELVKMLVKHSISIVIEVLVFAVARQMVVEHQTPTEILISIFGLAMLFVIRKYLFKDFDSTEKTVYRANQKVKLVNALEHIMIPSDESETLGDLIVKELKHSKEEIGTGSVVYFKGVALKIAKITDGEITRVEVIKQLA